MIRDCFFSVFELSYLLIAIRLLYHTKPPPVGYSVVRRFCMSILYSLSIHLFPPLKHPEKPQELFFSLPLNAPKGPFPTLYFLTSAQSFHHLAVLTRFSAVTVLRYTYLFVCR